MVFICDHTLVVDTGWLHVWQPTSIESKHSCGGEATNVTDRPIDYQDLGRGGSTSGPRKKMDSFQFRIPQTCIILPASSPQISEECLVTKWKHSPLLCQRAHTFKGSIIPTPTMTYTHTHTHMPSFIWGVLVGKIASFTQVEKSEQL